MKTKRLTMTTLVIAILVIASMILLLGCKTTSTTTGNTTSSTQAPQTLKIGVIAWLGYPIGLDMSRILDVMADMENQNGGLTIGGQKYKIEFIVYDSNGDPKTANAAANRLIFEDKVKFILSEFMFVDGWLPVANENKVVVVAGPNTPPLLDPSYHYCFQGNGLNSQEIVIDSWFHKNYPDKKSVVVGVPDNENGHAAGEVIVDVFKGFNMTASAEYYPPTAQDLSSLGTKVKTLNPEVFMAVAGGPISDGLAYKAVFQSGYKGQLFADSPAAFATLSQIIPAEALEGMINAGPPTEFDPALTEAAQKFKDAYTAKYGKWDDPEETDSPMWPCLKAALLKANSIDPDKVAAAIGSGLRWEGINGTFQMIARPDKGNDRTIDSVASYFMKTIQNGKPVLIAPITLDEALGYVETYYSR